MNRTVTDVFYDLEETDDSAKNSTSTPKRKATLDSLDFFTPIVMERIVMCVQAGHDILPALKIAVELAEREASGNQCDVVSILFKDALELVERGSSLENALSSVTKDISSRAVRHAFIHLALAHKQGGELIVPLRELSDATLLQYQETVEERIAKLPAKATLPLICTFAGLIINFLAVPIVQVITMTASMRAG